MSLVGFAVCIGVETEREFEGGCGVVVIERAKLIACSGIDYDTFESAAESGAIDKPYPNIIDEMLSQGVIERRAYSLWLDDLRKSLRREKCSGG